MTSVASLAARGPLELEEALGVLRDAAVALGKLHATGAAHGAVCCENLAVDAQGVVRLCRDTLAPQVVSPEQEQGGYPDVRSDVYALGCAVAALLPEAEPVPEPIARLLGTMTAEEPAERYQSMADVLTALEACELMTGRRAFRPGRGADVLRDRRRFLLFAVLLLSALMVGLALVVMLGRTPPRRGKDPESYKELLEGLKARPEKPSEE
jgi:hypothetical protein